ncbi:hypothetical protein E2C01_072607 [Portunus trituberculatus]|uniref:Uncharacterized protein n=1 Tax=Portunus trituberculatus TaxID=210409 RepID=A0A5B7I9E1_PORTR|nr:hypothetical protein [Portunus trituberculatus]
MNTNELRKQRINTKRQERNICRGRRSKQTQQPGDRQASRSSGGVQEEKWRCGSSSSVPRSSAIPFPCSTWTRPAKVLGSRCAAA